MMIDTYNGQNIDAYDGEKVDLIAVALGREFKDREKDRTRPIVLDFQPGNGSRYVLVFTPLTEGQARAVGNNWVLSLPEHGRCYPINVPGYQTPEYLMKHWLSGIGDAVPVSHLLNSAWTEAKKLPEPPSVITGSDLRVIEATIFSKGDGVTITERGDLEGDISGVWTVDKIHPATKMPRWTEPRFNIHQGDGIQRRLIHNMPQSALRLHDPMAEARGATDEQLAAAGHTDDTPCPGCSTVVEGFLDSVEGSSAEA